MLGEAILTLEVDMAELKQGDKAPAVTLVDQSGKKVSLSAFKG
jgi:peroxiredoxin